MTNIAWPDEATESLKKFWEQKLTAAQIAYRLGEKYTRNSVLGKLFRLSLLQKRPSSSMPRSPRTKTVLVAVPSKPSLPPIVAQKFNPPVPLGPPKSKRLCVLELTNETCRWPIGDVGHKDFHFCGHEPSDKSSYCAYHVDKARQPIRKATVSEQMAHLRPRAA